MAGLVLGILSLVLNFFGGVAAVNVVSLILAIIGIVASVKARKENPSGVATAGLVLSIIAVCLGGVTFFACTLCKLCAGAAADAAVDGILSGL